MEGHRKINIWIPEETHRDLRVLAAQRDTSVSDILRKLASAWVTREKEKTSD